MRFALLAVLALLAATATAQHIVVVGGGLAGLSASLQAAQLGAKVTLIEGEPRLGGNSAKATRCSTEQIKKS